MIALATCRRLADLHPDDKLLAAQFEQHGFATKALVWDDSDQALDDVSAVIVRSCWDYHFKPKEFLAWAEGVSARGIKLFNPATTLRWNHDKRYLRELESLGVAIANTLWFKQGTTSDLAHIIKNSGWEKAVLKPTISATAWNTILVTQGNSTSLQEKFDEMCASGAVMLQKFIENITSCGEWSFIFFENKFSHAVLKRPKSGDYRVQGDFGGFLDLDAAPPSGLIEEAQAILKKVKMPWLYARVDAVEVEKHLCLMELELIEPELYLRSSQPAANRFARAIANSVAHAQNS